MINDTYIKIKRAKEPKNYIWENMANTSQQIFRNKMLVIILFSTILAICYKIQYKYQYETTYLGTFEDIDCNLYHNSLPSKYFFETTDIEEGDLDPETIKIFKDQVNANAAKRKAERAAKKKGSGGGEIDTSNGPVALIKGFSGVKYQKEAYMSYDSFYHPVTEEDFTKTYINGTLTCFCKD